MPDPIPPAPRAPQVPFVRSAHSDDVADPYHWMADKGDPRLRAYLEAENAHTEAVAAGQRPLRDAIYAEIAARTKQTDLSVPSYVTHTGGDAWWYFSRTTEGLDYPVHCRLPAEGRDARPDVSSPHTDEHMLLDLNALAEGHDFLALGLTELSPDGRLLAYSVDTAGDERYDLYVADAGTGAVVDGPIRDVAPGGTWVGDGWLFYLRVDDAWRPCEVWRHQVASPEVPDTLVYTEPDERFWVWVDSSRDDAYAVIEVASKLTGEAHLVPASDPTGAPRCVTPRRPGVDYAVEVTPDAIFIVHNADHPQYALAAAPLDAAEASDWTTLVPGRDDRRLLGVTAYRSALVVGHRTAGLPGVAILPRDASGAVTGEWRELEFEDALHDVGADDDPDYDSDRFTISYESMVRPPEVSEQLLAGGRTLLKRTQVLDHPTLGPYRPDDYVTERLWATSLDGTAVPVSVVRRADTPVDGTAPGLLYGYGAYEISTDPFFSIARLSLLDRGFVFAIAHVRGGGELGRTWYEDGRLAAKQHSFDDFAAAARALIASGLVAPDRLLAEGGSAGGLLMGAVFNQAPELFAGVHAAVPFVDPLTTVLNPELPLTVTEWDEWGDPLHDADAYQTIKAYAPYDNLAPGHHPAVLVTAGLNDTRVEITEPAKWVARLRELSPDGGGGRVLLKTELGAGHGGVTARYQAWRDRAVELAWMISLVDADRGAGTADAP